MCSESDAPPHNTGLQRLLNAAIPPNRSVWRCTIPMHVTVSPAVMLVRTHRQTFCRRTTVPVSHPGSYHGSPTAPDMFPSLLRYELSK